jgi:hypothetical protein
MKFSKEFLSDGSYEDENTVVDEIVGHSRWNVTHRRVFKFEGRFYETRYSKGATEYQEEQPYEYDPDEIECKEVFPIPTIVYK